MQNSYEKYADFPVELVTQITIKVQEDLKVVLENPEVRYIFTCTDAGYSKDLNSFTHKVVEPVNIEYIVDGVGYAVGTCFRNVNGFEDSTDRLRLCPNASIEFVLKDGSIHPAESFNLQDCHDYIRRGSFEICADAPQEGRYGFRGGSVPIQYEGKLIERDRVIDVNKWGWYNGHIKTPISPAPIIGRDFDGKDYYVNNDGHFAPIEPANQVNNIINEKVKREGAREKLLKEYGWKVVARDNNRHISAIIFENNGICPILNRTVITDRNEIEKALKVLNQDKLGRLVNGNGG